MAIIIKSHKDTLLIDSTIGINYNSGNVLQGEKDMYERIVRDCEASPLTWYMWYDKTFNIPYGGQNEIQIDFLLICQEGAIIVEVKGGIIELIRGFFYYSYKGVLREMSRTPFKQAHDYKWALLNNGILNKDQIFVDYVCAFPHSTLDISRDSSQINLSHKLWNKLDQDSDNSFADFCLSVIRKNKRSKRIISKTELQSIVNSLAPSIEDRYKYSLTSLREVLDWLQIDNLSILEGLRKNPRILIEGGPGTGKTTMAKAFIKRHSGLKGLYLCWTGLLASKVRLDLDKERLSSCTVKTFNNYIKEITNIKSDNSQYDVYKLLSKELSKITKVDYDYIIIDEAQDVIDKGVDIVLNELLSSQHNGLKQGRYLVFYDLEQGYNNVSRNLNENINKIAKYAACFILDENKRVPTNKLIVEYANKVLSVEHCQEAFELYLDSLKGNDIAGLTISFHDNVREVKKTLSDLLLKDNNLLLGRLSVALSYMFRKVDWSAKEFFTKHRMIEEGAKLRNSYYMLPSGKGWYTFVTFLYENREAFNAYRSNLIPLLLQCEHVSLSEKDAPNLKKYVFSILADDVNQTLADDRILEEPDKNVIRLLFKWMNENPELIKMWVEKALEANSYKYKVIKEFLLLSEGIETLGFINTYPDIYKALIRQEWLDDEGIVHDYYPMIHQSSGLTTSFKCFFYSHPEDAIEFLCEILNYDIEKLKCSHTQELEKIKVVVDGNEITLLGNDYMWREYRGNNYQSHVRESLLMTFEKWMMDSIKNNNDSAKYALSRERLLTVFDIVYKKCYNVSAWGVLASVATRFPIFVGMKAMPIYSCRDFILWDKTRLSAELMSPTISPYASKNVQKEVADSYKLAHRKQDLEGMILRMSMTKGFADEFRKLVKHLKETATTYLEKVSAGRMDIAQYEIIGKTDKGVILQGSPSEDIKEEAAQNEAFSNQFNKILSVGNLSRTRYDEDSEQVIDEWREAYCLHKDQDSVFVAKGLVAALGVKKHWENLNKEERAWCYEIIVQETYGFAVSRMFQPYTEYSSDGLVYLLDRLPDDENLLQVIWGLIDAIDDNDSLFTRFENSFKSLIWLNHKELAEKIILQYIHNTESKRNDIDKFAHVCKLIPTDIEDTIIDEMAFIYCKQFMDALTDKMSDRYVVKMPDMRIEEFCAAYMVAKPQKRCKFIEEIWLVSSLKQTRYHYDRRESPIGSIFNHYCYMVTPANKDSFWQLWEIMFEWYKKNNAMEVLPSLMLSFDVMKPSLLENWEIVNGANEHIYKLLHILPQEGVSYLPWLVCKIGFRWLMPDCLRHIDKAILRQSSRDRRLMIRWQNAVEDLYDDAKTRDAIRRDDALRVAYVEVLNGLISNGSAIAYLIRDYYI